MVLPPQVADFLRAETWSDAFTYGPHSARLMADPK
jgi:hypothetical protein